MNAVNPMPELAKYTQLDFGLYVPVHVAEQISRLDLGTLDVYRGYLRGRGKSPATVEKYSRHIRSFILYLGERSLSPGLVRNWLEALKQVRSIRTVNGAISALNGLFRWLGRNDCTVCFYRCQEAPYREDARNLERGDFDRLLEGSDRRMRALLLAFYGTGIRVSELKFFTVEAVRSGRVEVDNKGKHRTVFLDPGTKDMLLNYCRSAGIHSGVIFRNRHGEALSRVYIWRLMKAQARRTGVPLSKVFPHNLRHLFAVERYRAEHDIESLRLDLGHSLIATTQRYLKETVSAHFERVKMRTAFQENKKTPPFLRATEGKFC